ncbi:MAG: hypothetical protein KAW56_00980 [Candidatus Marinimicrobia bacterium]|nr:hypothetical protein [Candidatus Neomarinimicrobiota bacterium]
MSFKISSHYDNESWTKLSIQDDLSPNWPKGIDIVKDRFESRFFNQINSIKDDEFSGFVIMSIDCLLVETLMQFYLGIDSTEDQYSHNQKDSFKDFLKNSKHFATSFNTNEKCYTFYRHFRCGLLHQAQTKDKSKINICRPYLMKLIDEADVKKGMIIDRNKFHDNLILEFNDYIERLEKNKLNFKNGNLRINCLKKMNMICNK